MIRRLHVKHWKSHEDTELHFSKGTNLFVGVMGSGKSAAMDAISFALFGTFPALKSRRVTLEETLMQRPHAYAQAEVELEFEVGNKKYRVVRTVSKKGSEAHVFCEDKLQEAQPQRSNELLEGVLKMDYDLFARVIYAEQNRIDALLQAVKGERKRQVDELLGLSRFESARSAAGTLANQLREKKRQEESFLEGVDAQAVEQEAQRLETRLQAIEKEKKAQEAGLHQAREESKQAETAVKGLEATERRFLQLEKRKEVVRALLEKSEKECAELGKEPTRAEDLSRAEEEANQKSREEAEKEKEWVKAVGAASQAEERQRELREKAKEKQRLQEKGKRLKHSPDALSSAQARWEEEQKKYAWAEAEIQELERSTASLRQASAQCPTCNTPLSSDQHQKLLQEKQRRLTEKKQEVRQLAQTFSALQNEWEQRRKAAEEQKALERQLQAYADLEEKEKENESELRQAQRELKKTQQSFEQAKKARQESEHRLEQARRQGERLQRLTHLEKQVGENRKELAEAEASLSKIKWEPRVLEEARNELRKKEQERAQGEEALKYALQREKEIRGQYEVVQQKREEIGKRRKKVDELEAKADTAARFQRSIVETQKMLREELVAALNHAMDELWGVLYPYGDYRAIRLLALEDDYALELRTPEGTWIGIETSSGGERSCAALALRVAFAMVLTPDFSWLILDEPTHNLDAEAVQRLSSVLRESLPGIVEQTFIVTHDEALKEGASSKVFFFERDKEHGAATVVEEISAVNPSQEMSA